MVAKRRQANKLSATDKAAKAATNKAARQRLAESHGYPSYHFYRKAQKQGEIDTSGYYRKLATGKGKIGTLWREISSNTSLDADDATIATAFAQMERKARYSSRSERRRIRAEFVESLGLSSNEASWLLYRLNQTP